MAYDPIANGAVCEVDGLYNDTDTLVDLVASEGGKLPATGSGIAFNLVWYDGTNYPGDPWGDPKVEVIRLTTRAGDELSVIERAQEGTIASTKNTAGATYYMALCFTKFAHDAIQDRLDNCPGGGVINTATISSGSIAYAGPIMNIAPEGAADDNLNEITGGTVGDILFLSNSNSSYTITVTDATNIDGAGNQYPTLRYSTAILVLRYDGTNWKIVCYWPSYLQWAAGPTVTTDIQTDRRLAIADPGLTPSVHTTAQVSIDADDDVALSVNRETGDGTIVALRQDGALEGWISVSGTNLTYKTFAGAHVAQLENEARIPPHGGVMVSTGGVIRSRYEYYEETLPDKVDEEGRRRKQKKRHFIPRDSEDAEDAWVWKQKDTSTLNNAGKHTYIEGTTTPGDQRVYGVYECQDKQDPRETVVGDPERPLHSIVSLGLFKIRVTDSAGDIATGDFLQSSARQYEAEKQADDVMHNYTVAKALVAVDWAAVKVDPVLGYKWTLIPATIHCG